MKGKRAGGGLIELKAGSKYQDLLWRGPHAGRFTRECQAMVTSVFEMFKIGVGPSSSHTVGPMVAGALFAHSLDANGLLANVHRVSCELFGSLALTGLG